MRERLTSSRPIAIVTDGLWRKSLSAIRSLGKAGYEVHVLGDSLFTTGYWSRYCAARVRAPSAERDPGGFGAALTRHLRRIHSSSRPDSASGASGGTAPRPVVLLPMEDASLRWVSGHRESLARKGYANLLIPSAESLAVAFDKGRTLELAQRLGLPAPGTLTPGTLEEFQSALAEFPDGNFVTKPRSGSGSAGLRYGAPLPGETWETYWKNFGPVLVQERVPATGRGIGVSLLFDGQGRCVAHFTHERIKQYPVSGGPSTDRKSIHDEALLRHSILLLEELGWKGLAMVEWKSDPRGGAPKLMEINPRFWGSLELAVRAGVDFPTLYASEALRTEPAGTPAEPPTYPDGFRCRWLFPGEILRWLGEPRGSRESFARFLSGLPGLAEEWDSTDLRGALATLICTGALALHPRYWKYVRRG